MLVTLNINNIQITLYFPDNNVEFDNSTTFIPLMPSHNYIYFL